MALQTYKQAEMRRRLSIDSALCIARASTKKLQKRYSNLVIGSTCLCSILGLLMVAGGSIAGTALLWSDIDLDFANLMKSDGHASNQWDSFTAALSDKGNSEGRRLGHVEENSTNTTTTQAKEVQEDEEDQEEQKLRAYRVTFDLFFGYEMKDGGNLLNGKVLNEVRNFETTLRNLPGWRMLCAKSESGFEDFCKRGVSMINYAFPTENQSAGYDVLEPQALEFNGEGTNAVPMSISLRKINADANQAIIFPRNFNVSETTAPTSTIRTLFRFRCFVAPHGTQKAVVMQKYQLLKDEFASLFAEEVYPVIQEADLQYVHVFYDGDGVKSHEILSTLWQDMHYAIGSAVFVLFYMVIHTGSIFLSAMGLLTIMLSIPSAYVLFALMSNGAVLTVASFLSLFLTIGLGADVIFVFTDFWRQSVKKGDIESRLAWTYAQALRATAATTLTTAASFFANLLSALRPVREFGFLMGLCVVMVFVLVGALFPQFCLLDHRWCSSCRLPKRYKGGGVVPIFFRYRWSFFIQRWKRLCILAFIALSIVALGCALGNAEASKGMPLMFPDDHNQVRGVEIFEEFVSIDGAADPAARPGTATSKVCSLQDAAEDCYLHWCEATDTFITEVGSHCVCSRITQGTCPADPGKGALIRIAGMDAGMRAGLQSKLVKHIAGSEKWEIKDFGSLVAQNWVTGETEVNPFVEAREQTPPVGDCYVEEHCYCGKQQCLHDHEDAKAAVLALQTSGVSQTGGTGEKRRLRNPTSGEEETQETSVSLGQIVPRSFSHADLPRERQLLHRKDDAPLGRGVPLDERAEVVAVFGIEPQGSQPLLGEYDGERWAYQSNFNPADPWAQRSMYKFCMKPPRDLLVVSRSCWIVDFHIWLVTGKFESWASAVKFPLKSRDFTEKLLEFSKTGRVGINKPDDFMWIENGQLKGAYVKFELDFSKNADAKETLNLKGKWDAHIQSFNQDHSDSTRGIWHTSTLWVRAEAETEILGSTLSVVLLAVGLAFLSMLLFTQDIILSTYVVLCTLGVIACLAFFIIIVMGWDLGAIEVIALIVFIGYAVTYSLHIAHKYGHRDPRLLRTKKNQTSEPPLQAQEKEAEKGEEEKEKEQKAEREEKETVVDEVVVEKVIEDAERGAVVATDAPKAQSSQEGGLSSTDVHEGASTENFDCPPEPSISPTSPQSENTGVDKKTNHHEKFEEATWVAEAGSISTPASVIQPMVSTKDTPRMRPRMCCGETNMICAQEIEMFDVPEEDEAPFQQDGVFENQAGMVQDPAGPPGQLYKGQIVQGLKHGTGVLHSQIEGVEGKIVYGGEFIQNKKQGHGVMQWPDGRKYVGQFENDELHGEGTMYWPDGQKHIGQYRHDMEMGQGLLTTPSGSKFMGHFEHGKRHGEFLHVRAKVHGIEMKPETVYFNMGEQAPERAGEDNFLIRVEEEFTGEELIAGVTMGSNSGVQPSGTDQSKPEEPIRRDNQDASPAEQAVKEEKLPSTQELLAQIKNDEDEERFERTRYALQSMGGAALGSAMTTVGSSFFLLFCTLSVFTKLGSIAIMVTFLSILYALLPLPAILVDQGPLPGKGCQSGVARGAVSCFHAFIHASKTFCGHGLGHDEHDDDHSI